MQTSTHVRVRKTCGIDHTNYKGGEIIPRNQIHAGSIDSAFRLGLIEPCDAPPEEATVAEPTGEQGDKKPKSK